jgi:hypothetical protein
MPQVSKSSSSLSIADFSLYPPLARELAIEHLRTLRGLPLVLAAVLLRQIASYDRQFPVERSSLESQLRRLSEPGLELRKAIDGFATISLSPGLLTMPWASQPQRFSEELTSYLWLSHQIDAFRTAALHVNEYLDPVAVEGPATPRLCIVLFGRDASEKGITLFEKLRPHGTVFTQVDSSNALTCARTTLQLRAQERPQRYAHWWIDGGTPDDVPGTVSISYERLAPVRKKVLEMMRAARTSGTQGPEELRSAMLSLRPEQLEGMHTNSDSVLSAFELSLLSDGSGTQVFSTTFVQWAAREALRRAQPSTLLVRYASRQRDRPLEELVVPTIGRDTIDPQGSLIDADMGAFYTWLNLGRLSGFQSRCFIACHEGGTQAIAIAPAIAAGAQSSQRCDLEQIVTWTAG